MLALTLWLLHTHILHEVNGTYHTGQSCYGDLGLHLAYIKSIAVRGLFPPVEPMLARDVAMGYPFLCETVSSVFLLLGAGLRFAYLLAAVPALVAVFGMAWQLARAMLAARRVRALRSGCFLWAAGSAFSIFLAARRILPRSSPATIRRRPTIPKRTFCGVNPIVDLLAPQRATLLGWCVLFAALYLLWRFAMQGEARLWGPLAVLVLPLPLIQTHAALALVLCCLVCGVYTLAARPHTRAVLLPWAGLAALCAAVWLPETLGTVIGHAVNGENMLRLHFNWVNNDGGFKDNYFWFYIKNSALCICCCPGVYPRQAKAALVLRGGALVWAVAECVVFQTNLYDNNKLL